MRTTIPFVLCALFVACGGAEERPSDVLPRDRFTAVLCDLQLVEARINHELVVEPIGTIPTERYSEEVFERHAVSKEEFRTSMAYYGGRHEEMVAIYEEVIAELTRRKDQAPTAGDPRP